MKSRFLKINVILLLVILFAGCFDNKKDVNEENFTEAINKYYNKRCLAYNLIVPQKIDVPKDKASKKIYKEMFDNYNYFVKLGYLNVKEEIDERKATFGNKVYKRKIKLFTLTKKGEKHYNKSNYGGGFCYGNFKVEKILNFTEPDNTFGKTVSLVKFTRTLINISDFAKSDEFKKIYENGGFMKRKLFDYNKEAKRNLILTKNGWVDRSELR